MLAVLLLAASAVSYRITIDPGHGGSDPGAVGNGLRESDITLDIALRLRDLLVADSGRWQVQMTRTSDSTVELSTRVNMANAWPADRFVSIHVNSFSDPSANGTETYSYSSTGTAASLRNVIQEEMVAAWGLRNRGAKTADFYVLRETTMPATLSETGFITNAYDASFLGSASERQIMAVAHMQALRRHYGFPTSLDGVPGGEIEA
eukprot:TRINITY_DN12693_c0_g1_i1.p1 TRINITY_DN12693_c0_g1~~TRINITY_DN12693_c0_g1_i1.p1  ORF type:complete len:218 (+),score=47.35 TRINITY_DN12693_c0_g1_i1:38-655(+)